jgi:predicted dehydrogenase
MAKSKQVRAVLAGCGGMAHHWMSAIKLNTDVTVVGVSDIRKETAVAFAQKHGIAESGAFDKLGEALKALKPDVVFDVTIPAAHDAVVTEALKFGCDVLGEKPMSDTLAKARKMVATSASTGRLYAVLQNYRYNPQIQGLRTLLRSKAIGSVEELHADFFIGAHFGGFRDEMDYPLILDMSIHTFDASRFLSGADPVSVYCHAFNPKRSWYKGDASAVAVFEMSDGIVFSYRGSWCSEGLHTPWNSQWRIVGSKGTATWDGADTLKAQAVKKGGKPGFFSEFDDLTVELGPKDALAAHAGVISDFLKARRTGKPPMTVCTDNIKSLAMVLAAVRSAKSGKREKVQW